ncbi:hypothetical protein [Roseivirga echinicomitans]|uniref:Uncharacterized protein n=1 Tax=Roseivirga echinicomitans TaxID=296218 RepID=A0A150XXN4_9BACT|nr:hypothetical protein [Roseivirga echinicomitans]KYG83511.1 hypothetical protein AWN68_01525 [Roseivirga echinicomitans]
MDSIYLDLILSGLTYVILTYLTFQLMKSRKVNKHEDDDEGGINEFTPPNIDLPPGVVWPDSPLLKKRKVEKAY